MAGARIRYAICLILLLCHRPPALMVVADSGCGHNKPVTVRDGRIVNGVEAIYDQFPWLVSVQYYSDQHRQYLHYCGGSIVAPDIIVTAAHCSPLVFARKNHLNFDRVKVVAGCLKWNAADEDEHCQSVEVDGNWFTDHPEYAHSPIYDISVARLPAAFTLTDSVTTICLPRPGNLYKGMATIAGWGKHSENQKASDLYFNTNGVMRTADVNILPPGECNKYMATRFDADLSICAGFPSGARDSCQGDSGGPLMAQVSDQVFLIGVVSFGAGCAKPGYPGVYVRIAAQRLWIDEVVGWS